MATRGTIKARVCPACGHHELVLVDEQGREIPLRPGDEITLHELGTKGGGTDDNFYCD
ncbi:MAG: hypothetical protein JRI36_05235 [Deltaproteobacteria bacterium]|nr:hypothetical protein [Deltaproteobacteria bacterium]